MVVAALSPLAGRTSLATSNRLGSMRDQQDEVNPSISSQVVSHFPARPRQHGCLRVASGKTSKTTSRDVEFRP